MKVLFLDHAAELGGAEVSLLELLRTLDRARFAPTLAGPQGRLADRARALGIPFAELHLEKLLKDRNPFRAFARLRRGLTALRRIIAEGDFALVHANTLRTALYAVGSARRLKARLLWHVRDYAMPAWVRRRLLRRCDAAVAPSRFIAKALGDSRKVRIIPNGIDLATVPGAEAGAAFRRELRIGPDVPLVGTLGRLLPWKGQHHFIDAAARLAPRLPNARFIVVGSALYGDPRRDYPAELKAQAAKLGLGDAVLFVGQRDDPLAALSAMDIVVNCSENEPFGRVLIEAMACARPIVAFGSGAVPEVVEDRKTGLLVPFPDTSAMAEAVLALLRDRPRATAYGKAGRQRVAAKFSLAASTKAIEGLYTELLGAP